jgi:hypothetical protein
MPHVFDESPPSQIFKTTDPISNSSRILVGNHIGSTGLNCFTAGRPNVQYHSTGLVGSQQNLLCLRRKCRRPSQKSMVCRRISVARSTAEYQVWRRDAFTAQFYYAKEGSLVETFEINEIATYR